MWRALLLLVYDTSVSIFGHVLLSCPFFLGRFDCGLSGLDIHYSETAAQCSLVPSFYDKIIKVLFRTESTHQGGWRFRLSVFLQVRTKAFYLPPFISAGQHPVEHIPGEFLLYYVSSLAVHTNLFPIKMLCAEEDLFSFCRIRLSL